MNTHVYLYAKGRPPRTRSAVIVGDGVLLLSASRCCTVNCKYWPWNYERWKKTKSIREWDHGLLCLFFIHRVYTHLYLLRLKLCDNICGGYSFCYSVFNVVSWAPIWLSSEQRSRLNWQNPPKSLTKSNNTYRQNNKQPTTSEPAIYYRHPRSSSNSLTKSQPVSRSYENP